MKKLKLAALFAALIVGLGLYQFLQEIKTPQEAPHTTVVVAAVDIPENTQITTEMVTLRSIADDSLLENYILDPQNVVGMVMTSDLYAGEQITKNRLVRVGEADSDKKTLAYTLKPGMRAITIYIDKDTGLVNFLKPGNRVDILLNYSHQEVKPDLLDETQLNVVQVPTTQLLAQNLSLLAVGSVMGKNGAEEYTSVTLEVTPQEAMNINAAAWWGNLRLLLRSPLDEEILELDLVNQETVYAESAGE